jgi:hypothetical protein
VIQIRHDDHRSLATAVLLSALQIVDPNARTILSQELASMGSIPFEASQIAPALIAAYRWVHSGAEGAVVGKIPHNNSIYSYISMRDTGS